MTQNSMETNKTLVSDRSQFRQENVPTLLALLNYFRLITFYFSQESEYHCGVAAKNCTLTR